MTGGHQKMNLKEAKKKGKLAEFIQEHEKDPNGDADLFGEILEKATHSQKSKSTQETSSLDIGKSCCFSRCRNGLSNKHTIRPRRDNQKQCDKAKTKQSGNIH